MAFETGSLRTDVLNISIRQAQMTEVPVKSLKKNFTGLPCSDVTPENSLDTYNRIATTDRKDPMGKILSWFDHYRKLGALLNYETKKGSTNNQQRPFTSSNSDCFIGTMTRSGFVISGDGRLN